MSDAPWLGELSADERAEALWEFAADDDEMLTQIADAIRDAEQRAAARAREEAAKLCDTAASLALKDATGSSPFLKTAKDARKLAAAIRALP